MEVGEKLNHVFVENEKESALPQSKGKSNFRKWLETISLGKQVSNYASMAH